MLTKVARASEIELKADIEDIDDAFPEDLRINFYRIVQEGAEQHREALGCDPGHGDSAPDEVFRRADNLR